MEKTMRDYILEEFDTYTKCASQLDDEKFMNDVLKSFKDSKTYKHYVTLIPSDLNEYFIPVEHQSFSKYGYYQQPIEERYSNRFFIPPQNIEHACELLRNEKMAVETVKGGFPIEIKVVTLSGFGNSHFGSDFSAPKTPNE